MNSSQVIKIKAQALKRRLVTLPIKIGDTAILFSKQRFREQAWVDNATIPWKPRKPGAVRNRGRALLVSSGRLRRSIRIIRTTGDSVTIGSNVPYAQIHNDGFNGTQQVSAHTRTKWKKERVETGSLTKSGKKSMKTVTSENGTYSVKSFSRKMNMPRRRFMGKSAALERQLGRLISSEIMKSIKY